MIIVKVTSSPFGEGLSFDQIDQLINVIISILLKKKIKVEILKLY